MKIYILTSVALFAEYGDIPSLDSPSVHVTTYPSLAEAQKAMRKELDTERRSARAAGYGKPCVSSFIQDKTAVFLNDNSSAGGSFNRVDWEISEAEAAVPDMTDQRRNLIKQIHAFVCANGHPVKTGEPGTTGLVTRFDTNDLLCIGGYNGEQNEIVDSLVAYPDGSIGFDTEYCLRSQDEVCTDDLDYVLTWLMENADALPLVQEYFQPELIATKDVPEKLASFQVFPTREDCKAWMDRNGYLEGEYTVETYHGDNIEEPTFLNGEGEVILEL